MGPERAIVAIILLAIAGGCAWGAARAFRGPSSSAGRQAWGIAGVLGTLFFGGWAATMLAA
jgi:hypothetical protein